MAEKIRKFMRSERGRAFVNAMFILATMVRGNGMMFLADIFWVVWLLFCIRESKTKAESNIWMLCCSRCRTVWDEFVWMVDDKKMIGKAART